MKLCITDDAAIAVYGNGYKLMGDIHSALEDALSNAEFDVFRLKIDGESWFISDGKSEYDYRM